MPKYVLGKLVRDRLPEMYAELGEVAELRRLKDDELWRALKQKFIEEVSELPDSTDDKEALTIELADLLRIIKDAATLAGVDMDEIEKADAKKIAEKGGFLEGAYIETLELKDDDTWNEYYRNEPTRFPEA
jgi:predicted house-cleaning noncanonical NTP pyrophosphatase (MazG superfamily)